jgi:hypothetical protein
MEGAGLRRSSGGSSSVALLLGVVAFAAALALLRPGARGSVPLFGMSGAGVDEPWACETEDCLLTGPFAETGPTAPTLDGATVCPESGYLCLDPDTPDGHRVLRWPDTRTSLSVRVPLPQFEDPIRARALRSAAVRGIQAWQGRPFALHIRDRSAGEPADIVVRWTEQLNGSSLGHTRSEWRDRNGQKSLRIVDFALATRSPYNPRHLLSAHDVELVSAHEMGHAHGLPHSDSPRDVMYPTNTARSLSARDYRTLEALYGLPNGARIEVTGSRGR